MSHQKSVIIYGPQGCGKTRNAEKLMKHFGLSKSEDLDPPIKRKYRENHGGKIAQVDVLYLTNMTRDEMVKLGVIDTEARRVFAFEDAMGMLR